MVAIDDQDTSTNLNSISMEFLSEELEKSKLMNCSSNASSHSMNENANASEKGPVINQNAPSSTIIFYQQNSNHNNSNTSNTSDTSINSSIEKKNPKIEEMCPQFPALEEPVPVLSSVTESELMPASETPMNMNLSISVPSRISSSARSSFSSETNDDKNMCTDGDENENKNLLVDDDNDTVSSLDSNENHTNNMNQTRSIFGNYWKNTIHEEPTPNTSTCSSHILSQQSSQSILCSPHQKGDTNHSPQTLMTASTTISSYELSSNFTPHSPNMMAAARTMSSISREAIMPLPDEFTYQEFNRDFNAGRQDCATEEYEEILKNNEVGRTTLPHSTSLKDVNVNVNIHGGHTVEHDGVYLPSDLDTSSRLSHHSNSTKNSHHTQNNSNTTSTRSLFINKYASSSPSLCYGYREIAGGLYMNQRAVRKTVSASSLTRRKKPSILRSRSLSLDSTGVTSMQSNSTSRFSVSFDAKVFVHEYEKPQQRYTNNGWSKYFTS